MKVKFKEWDCVAIPGWYAYENRPAITLVTDDEASEPVATATVNLVDDYLPINCVHIKEYSENVGMTEALEKAGIVTRIAQYDITYPGTTVSLCQLTYDGRMMFAKAENPTPKSFDDFFNEMTIVRDLEKWKDESGIEVSNDVEALVVFSGYYHIEQLSNCMYHLVIGNQWYASPNLILLANILWDDFVKHEYDISEDDLQEDLHERARSIIHSLDLNCSLDEIPLDRFSPSLMEIRDHLMEQFDK